MFRGLKPETMADILYATVFFAILWHSTSALRYITVVGVFDEDYTLPREVIRKTLLRNMKKDYPDVNVTYYDMTADESYSEISLCESLHSKSPTLIIDATRRMRESDDQSISALVRRFARQMRIPTVSAAYSYRSSIPQWQDLDDDEKEYLIAIPPPGDIVTQVVRDIAIHQNMTTTGVLYDNSVEIGQKYAVLLENIATRASVLPISSDTRNIARQLNKMRTSGTAYFFVLGSAETIGYTLDVAENNNLAGREFAWFLVSMDQKEPSCNCKSLKVLWLSPKIQEQKDQKLEVLAKEFMEMSEVEVAFYYDLVYLTVKSVLKAKADSPDVELQATCSSSKAISERQPVKLLTEMKQITHRGIFGDFVIKTNGRNYQEIELYMRSITYRDNGNPVKKRIGTWKFGMPSGRLNFNDGENLKSFSAVTVYKITTIVIPPFVEKVVHENGTVEFGGYCIDLINEIKDILNFEYEIFETEDKKFGTMNEKLEWDGMIKDLIDKRADIALGPISVMAERETVVDFTVPFYDLVGISILMKRPSIPSSLFKFLTVLEANVWGCILAAYFFTSFLMYVFDRMSPYSYSNNKEKYVDDDDDEKRDFTLKESLWFCMTSLTPQGGGEAPRNLSGRLVAATWWLFGFIIIASYTANLAAFLTVSRLDSSIESLDDLAKQYKIKYAPQESTSAATYFERMAYIEDKFYEIWKNMSLDDSLNETERAKLAVWDYPVSDKYTKIWWTMKETKLPKTFEEGIERVLQSKGTQDGFAFIADATQVKYAVMTNCELIPVGSEFSRKPLALAVQQGSPLKDQLSSSILKLLNQRKLEGLKEKWWNKNPAKANCEENEQQSDGISIANIGGVFIVIFIGVVLACITLAVEYLIYRKRMPNSRIVTLKRYPERSVHRRRT